MPGAMVSPAVRLLQDTLGKPDRLVAKIEVNVSGAKKGISQPNESVMDIEGASIESCS